VRSAFNWHATRDDEFISPIVKGMARTTLKELSRDRVLNDDEIRSVWTALDHCEPSAYRRLVRALLLSAARLNEIARMQWPEIVDDVVVVPGFRTKAKLDHAVPITPALEAEIGERAEGDVDLYIFSTTRGLSPFSGFSKAKKRLDVEVAKVRAEIELPAMPPWRLHDLRRTARSLMSRARVDSDIAERVLGHALPGMRGVYDRFEYLAEKRDTLERLAGLLETIIDRETSNLLRLRTAP